MNINGYNIKIFFSNGSLVNLYRKDTDKTEVTNYVTSLSINESMYTENNNPIGVISSNEIKIELVSLDRSLIPHNESSPYFGLMGTGAEIEIGIIIDNNTVVFGRYYISNWISDISSDNYNKVTIEGTDLISKLMKSSLPDINLKTNIGLKDMLNEVSEKLNNSIEDKYKFEFVYQDEPMFNVMNSNDIECDEMGTFLNTLCQSTLTNLFIDRDSSNGKRQIKIIDSTKVLGNDTIELSDRKEITYARMNSGSLVNYNGVTVTYSIINVNNQSSVKTIGGLNLKQGENTIENISLDGVYKINSVSIMSNSEDCPVEIKSLKYNRKSATLVLVNTSNKDIEISLEFIGQKLNENNLFITKKSTAKSSETLEVTNKLIPLNKVETYANQLLSLTEDRKDRILLRGLFNPREIRVGTIVNLDCGSINVKGKFRVVSCKFELDGEGLTSEIELVRR